MKEKLDIHKIEQSYKTLLDRIQKSKDFIKENEKFILDFLYDCELGKTLKNKQKKKIGVGRRLRLGLTLCDLSQKWLKKPFDKVTQKEMENFILALERGEIKTNKGKPYTKESQLTFKRVIKKFYKWLLGKGEAYPEIVSWIDMSGGYKEIDALRREDVEKLVDMCSDIRYKALIMFLFDSGTRIDECLNVLVGDLELKDEFYRVRIKYSKTKPRTISLPLATPRLKQYIQEYALNNKPDTPLFDLPYDKIRLFLNRFGKKILGRPVNPHLLRHSSASYYANLIKERYKFCYRYGWAMSSDMPDRYIDRNGIVEEETLDIVKADEISKYKEENKLLKENVGRINESMIYIERKYNLLLQEIDEIKKLKKAYIIRKALNKPKIILRA